MNQVTSINTKKEEIQALLEEWVRKENILASGEQLVFTLAIRLIPVVVDETPKELIDMTVKEFFSRKRIAAAGVNSRYHSLILSELQRQSGTSHSDCRVRELIPRYTRREDETYTSATTNAIRTILEHNGFAI